MGLGKWFKSVFSKIGSFFSSFVKKAWVAANPFFDVVLSESARAVWSGLQDLAVEACGYVAQQGLPTSSDKTKAFREYMEKASHNEIVQLRDSELNLLQETALAIYKKATESGS